MRWIELLVVRASEENIQKLLIALPGQLRELADITGLNESTVLTNKDFNTDLSIKLEWEGEQKPDKSREGICLLSTSLLLGW